MLKPVSAVILAAVSVSVLASCASGPPRTPTALIDRVLANSPGNASPGKVVAAELAFARAAREQGQWTAFREFMASGGLLHGRSGPFEAGPWLVSRRDPAEAIAWAPRAVWMSCDGHLAVSRGRSLDPQGLEGSFVTVWQRQQDGEYRWIYDMGAPDVPQPVPAPQADDGAIVVLAEELIQGYVADCPPRGQPLTAPTPRPDSPGMRSGGGASPDGTLRWRWKHAEDGTRSFIADYFADGRWQTAVNQSYAPEVQN